MSSQPADNIISWLKSSSRVASGFAILVAGAVLVGWALDSAVLVGVAPTYVAMNPLTALAFILAGCSLWLLHVPTVRELGKLSRQRLAQACAGAVLLVGLLRLSEIVFGWHVGLDQILFSEKLATAPAGWPNRMAPNTALNFVLLGSALLLLDVETRRGRRPAQYLALGATFVAVLALVGYAYGVGYLYGFARFIPMALNTAVVFLTLSLGVLCARPDRGQAALFVSTGAGGSVVRWLLPAAIVVPMLFGWLRWEGERTGLYGTSFGIALFTTAMVLALTFLVWRNALSVERVDEQRQQAQGELIRARDELKTLNQSLEQKVEERTAALRAEVAERQRAEEALGTSERKFRQLVESAADAIVANDAQGRILLVNAQTETLFGYSREELLGQPLEILVPERFREAHRRGCVAFFADPNLQRMQGVTNLGGRHKDGREFPVEITLSPLETPEGLLAISIIRDVTERQRAEDALRASERRFRHLVQSAPDAIVGTDREGRIVLTNAQTERLFGYTGDELLGQSVEILLPERFRGSHVGHRAGYLTEPRARPMGACGMNLCGRRKDGSEFPVDVSLSPIETEKGLLVTAAIRDLTERQRAEEALRRSQASLAEAQRTAHLGSWEWDIVKNELRWSDEIYRIFGLTPQEFDATYEAFLAAVHPHDREFVQKSVEAAFHDGKPYSIDHRIVRADGSERVVHEQAEVFFDAASKPVRMVGTVQDITERKQAEQEINRLFTLSLDLLCVAGFDGYFKRLNQAWEKTLGFTTADLLAKPYLDFVHPEDRPATLSETEKLAQGATVISFENRYRSKDGSYRWLQWVSYPIAEEQLIYAAARDITARKRAEESLMALNRTLELRTEEITAVNKELEAFTYSVSHDLRAPLRHIDGFSKLLLEEHSAGLPEQARHYLHRVREGTQQMGQLVDDLLNLGRVGRQSLRPQVTGLNSLVENVLTQLQPEILSRTIEWQIAQLPFVECDPSLMKQVFQNLLSNAVKFTRPRQPAVIEVNQMTVNGQSAVYVRDNGVGFSMKYADKLFGVFQRLHRQEDFEGTGVGLATVQRILHKHGGRIWAEAELDKGATFYFTVGTAEENEAESRPLATARGEP